MMKTIRIRSHELGLWFKYGELHRVLGPGAHRAWTLPFPSAHRFEVFNTLVPRFAHELLPVLAKDERLRGHLEVVDLEADQRAIVWIDGRLHAVLGPGLRALWKGAGAILVERFSANDVRFEHPKLEAVLKAPEARTLLAGVRVEAHERVMLFRDGELVERLGPGHFVYWTGGPSVRWVSVDMREQVADIQGQEIMTADKVSLRMNLVVTHRVTDPERAVSEVTDWSQALYREAQLELRSAIGGRTLEKLLSDKDAVGDGIRDRLSKRARAFGVDVSGVGLRDIILPGDMKAILNSVILAQKEAEANLIKRREETAAARSQANTAKLLAENPALARMKELEALQDILKGSKVSFVLGSGDLVEQVSTLVRQDVAPPD
ncbi:MAG: slipin family protein [Planctomycetota bacterium]